MRCERCVCALVMGDIAGKGLLSCISVLFISACVCVKHMDTHTNTPV